MFLCDVVPSVMDDKSEQYLFPYWYEGKLTVAAWRVGNQSKKRITCLGRFDCNVIQKFQI